LAIDHHHGRRSLLQGQLGLLPDLGEKFTVVCKHQAAGIHQLEVVVSPERLLIKPVAGDTGLVVHDGLPAAAQPVDKSRLSHVRSPENGHHRQSHAF
jgi:hypothetical protein